MEDQNTREQIRKIYKIQRKKWRNKTHENEQDKYIEYKAIELQVKGTPLENTHSSR